MVCLIICSFANFYFVIDQNLKKEESSYFKTYYGNTSYIMNAITSVYMLGALGDFSTDDYQKGFNGKVSISMFILATFVIQVIFMNMLICIMSEVFVQVQEVSDASSMMEQVNLIKDHEFLVDLQKMFDGQKYIFIVSPETY